MEGIVMDQLVTTVRDQQWHAMVSEQKKSGLTIKAWCSENGISKNCFYYRQQKHLLKEMPKHMMDDHRDMSFLNDLLPWSEALPAKIRKPME